MNVNLTKSIINHIYSSLMIIPSNFINYDKNKSLLNKEFLLDKKIDLNDENSLTISNNVWGSQGEISGKKITLLVANCSLDSLIKEYSLIVSLDDAPSYGCYLVVNDDYDSEALISCTMDGKNWMECNTYLQSTFLAGMEQIKDYNVNWNRLENYNNEFLLLCSFLIFHNSIYGVK